FKLHQDTELGAIEFSIGSEERRPGQANNGAGCRDCPKPHAFRGSANGHLVHLEIAVKTDDRAVHAQHPGIRLSPAVADLLGCRQVQFEKRKLGVLIAHEALPFWRRNSSASKTWARPSASFERGRHRAGQSSAEHADVGLMGIDNELTL